MAQEGADWLNKWTRHWAEEMRAGATVQGDGVYRFPEDMDNDVDAN